MHRPALLSDPVSPHGPAAPSWDGYPTPYRLTPSPLRKLLAPSQVPGMISLALGAPEPAWFPQAELAEAAQQVLGAGHGLNYGSSDGLPALRAWLAEQMRTRGIAATSEQILMTNGSQHGLQVALRLLSGRESAIGLESPTYPGAQQAAELTGVPLHALPLADGRMPDLEHLAWLRREQQVRVLWSMPTARNPTGVTLDRAERELLAGTCARLGVALVEDDPYHDLWYDAPPAASLAALHPATIVAGSFSKVLAPGLRLGWLCVPATLVGPATVALQATCLGANHLAQQIVWTWLQRGGFPAHLTRLRNGYRQRRDGLRAALQAACPQLTIPQDAAGGLFHWVKLPPGVGAQALSERALAHGVTVIPGGAFHVGGAPDDHLRLAFSLADEVRSVEGARRLGLALG